ncbi:MAG: hypothetical protein MRERC_1c114 [Mycoplasmataceae bacterium RC_NB112A]|nr:MAG: hypothetical protein MRERC_1c114 [Mycoplasmataceae bacterium RC_NB112A]
MVELGGNAPPHPVCKTGALLLRRKALFYINNL